MFDSLLPAGKETITLDHREGAHVRNPLKLDEVISLHISNVLRMTKGKVHGPGGAAELLGIKANTLRARMDKLGIKYGRNK
jgi:transcriptional regulator with GAF, ATPase, and Fis domain